MQLQCITSGIGIVLHRGIARTPLSPLRTFDTDTDADPDSGLVNLA